MATLWKSNRAVDTILGLSPIAYYSSHIYTGAPTGTRLDLWHDISPTLNHGLRVGGNPLRAPTIKANQLNGKAVVSFASANQQWLESRFLSGISGSNGRTFFCISKDYNSGGAPSVVAVGSVSSTQGFALGEYLSNKIYLDALGLNANTSTVNGSWGVYAGRLVGTNQVQLWKNGSIVATSATGTINTLNTKFHIGKLLNAPNFLNTDAASIVAFNSNLSDADMGVVFSALNSIWGIY